jgi:GMP synthase-like glutamine amidotransferase
VRAIAKARMTRAAPTHGIGTKVRHKIGRALADRNPSMHVLVFQHLAVEHPGIFRDLWSKAGHTWRTVELDQGEQIPELDEFDLLVVMGGPMDVWQEDLYPWLIPEKAAIRRWVMDLDRPFLGVCLGHQLLAAALGGTVSLMRDPEVGLAAVELTEAGKRDPLLANFASPIETFQWHGAEISSLPAGMTVLAKNAACPVQAVRFGRHAYGFQYHVEITETTVGEWAGIPEYKASLERALGKERAAYLEGDVVAKLGGFGRAAGRLDENLRAIVDAARPLDATRHAHT